MKRLAPAAIRAFQKKIYEHYRMYGRDLPWRKTRNPYRILVSEIMLQQTQADRVLQKYSLFLKHYPDFKALAAAPVRDLLAIWQGLGYNRRALSLKKLAMQVVAEHAAKLPKDPEQLLSLPGIGKYTAGAVAAFAFRQPAVFMDTNIRRVFIHTFFSDKEQIADADILPLVQQTLDASAPHAWYNALMDYGAMLAKEHRNANRKSAHYTRQTRFENSNRQVRGRILKVLVAESRLTIAQIVKKVGMDADRVKDNLVQMEKEGFIKKTGRSFVV